MTQPMRFSDRVAVVTGGGSGLGASICTRLAADGHAVAVLDRNEEASAAVVTDIRTAGGQAVAVGVDVSDETSVHDEVAAVRRQFGPVEILVTSAAVGGFTRFDQITLAE